MFETYNIDDPSIESSLLPSLLVTRNVAIISRVRCCDLYLQPTNLAGCNAPRNGSGYCCGGFARFHVRSHEVYDRIGVWEVAHHNHGHVFRSVPALVKCFHGCCRHTEDDALQSDGQPICVLSTGRNSVRDVNLHRCWGSYPRISCPIILVYTGQN